MTKLRLVKGNRVAPPEADMHQMVDMRQMCTYLCNTCFNAWGAPYIGDAAKCPKCSNTNTVIVPGSGRMEKAPRV